MPIADTGRTLIIRPAYRIVAVKATALSTAEKKSTLWLNYLFYSTLDTNIMQKFYAACEICEKVKSYVKTAKLREKSRNRRLA